MAAGRRPPRACNAALRRLQISQRTRRKSIGGISREDSLRVGGFVLKSTRRESVWRRGEGCSIDRARRWKVPSGPTRGARALRRSTTNIRSAGALRVFHLSPRRETGRRGRGKGVRSSGRNAGARGAARREHLGEPQVSSERPPAGELVPVGLQLGSVERSRSGPDVGLIEGCALVVAKAPPTQVSRARTSRRRMPHERRWPRRRVPQGGEWGRAGAAGERGQSNKREAAVQSTSALLSRI